VTQREGLEEEDLGLGVNEECGTKGMAY